ncbi:MAG TPA: hypothetical protein VGE67_14565 [Haloferula sp.]
MLSEEQAIAIASGHWNANVRDPGDQFALGQALLCSEGDFWVIHGNTKASVVDGDFLRTMVGNGGYLVDAITGELVIMGSSQQTEQVLRDIRDTRAAEGLHYVLAAGTGSADHSEVAALRKLVPCGIMQGRRLLASPDRYWFTGLKRILENHANSLQQIGMPCEVILVSDPAHAIPVDSPWDFKWDLRKLAERIGTYSQENSSDG